MGRAARRKQERKNGKDPKLAHGGNGNIALQNPVNHAGQFPQWIFGNAISWEQMALASLRAHAPDEATDLQVLSDAGTSGPALSTALREKIRRTGSSSHMVEPESAKGQHLILCGAGPSLTETAAAWCPKGDQVWACNSALPYLAEHGLPVTHGFTVDQTPEMLAEWFSVPAVEYLLATTVHPHLTEFLMGRGRSVRFFHNFVGVSGRRPVRYADGTVVSYECWLYDLLYPSTICCGSGLNAINRAIDLARFVGAGHITVLGADCAMRFRSPPPGPIGSPEYKRWLRDEVTMHADGGNAVASNSSELTMYGEVCGDQSCDGSRANCNASHTRAWLTKVDMAISASWLEHERQKYPDLITLVGDTLPNALRGKPDSYLRGRLPTLVDAQGNPLCFA